MSKTTVSRRATKGYAGRRVRLVLLLTLLLTQTLSACSSLDSGKVDLTAGYRDRPFDLLRWRRHKTILANVPVTEDIYLIPDADNFYAIVNAEGDEIGNGCLSAFIDRNCVIEQAKRLKKRRPELIGFTRLSSIVGPRYKEGEIEWYLVTIKNSTFFGYQIAWMDNAKRTGGLHQLNPDALRAAVAARRCSPELAHSQQPCKRTVGRFLRLHYDINNRSGADMTFESREGLFSAVKYLMENRGELTTDPIQPGYRDALDWRFQRLPE